MYIQWCNSAQDDIVNIRKVLFDLLIKTFFQQEQILILDNK